MDHYLLFTFVLSCLPSLQKISGFLFLVSRSASGVISKALWSDSPCQWSSSEKVALKSNQYTTYYHVRMITSRQALTCGKTFWGLTLYSVQIVQKQLLLVVLHPSQSSFTDRRFRHGRRLRRLIIKGPQSLTDAPPGNQKCWSWEKIVSVVHYQAKQLFMRAAHRIFPISHLVNLQLSFIHVFTVTSQTVHAAILRKVNQAISEPESNSQK